MDNLKVQQLTVENKESRTDTGQTETEADSKRTHLPKTHQDYWPSKLRKRSYLDRNGRRVEVPEWQVRMQKDGQESWFNLGTPNQAAASKNAKEIFAHLLANGWESTLAKFKSDSGAAPKLNLTVGDYLEAVQVTGLIQIRTLIHYTNCLRTMVSEIFGVKADRSRFDYRGEGNKKWVGRIDSIRLQRVTPDRVEKWKQRRVKDAGRSPVAIASARRTTNAYVRCARSLFSPKVLAKVKGVKLPSPLPFDGVDLYEAGSMKYVSKIDVNALIASAKTELKPSDTEAYKAFLLGLFAGMRKGEIDLAEWRMVDWQTNVIKLEQTEFLHLKTEDSAGEITVDEEVIAELRQFLPVSTSQFIISSEVTRQTPKTTRTWTRPPRNDSARAYYRCEPVFDRLNAWLRSKGVRARKPLHELRKEIGSQIAKKQGIYAASSFLRHSDITTTARHYADYGKTRISAGLGKFLDTEIKPVAAEQSGK